MTRDNLKTSRCTRRLMHSDQMRKDGISEPMIQALYYDFVANYVKTRMYSTRYVQCKSGEYLVKVHSFVDRQVVPSA